MFRTTNVGSYERDYNKGDKHETEKKYDEVKDDSDD
jgi:hypothetical protein